jgi:hypothetical protein
MVIETREKAGFWVLVALTAVNILSFPVLPSEDGGAHAYYASAWEGVLSGEAPYSTAYVLRGGVPPYVVDLGLRVALTRAVSSIWAEKLIAATAVVLLCAGFRAFAGWRAAWLALPFAVNKQLMMGFANFSLGLGILFFLLAYWKRNAWLALGLTALLLFTHPVPLLFGLLYMSAETAARGWKRREVALAGGCWASALYVMHFSSGGGAQLDLRLKTLWEKSLMLADLVPVSPLRALGYRLLLAVAISCGLVLALKTFRRGDQAMEKRLPLAAGILCLAAYPVMPFMVNGSAFFDERFPLFGLLLIFRFAGETPQSANARRWIPLALGALTLLVLGWQQTVLRPWANALEVLATAPAMPMGARGIVVTAASEDWDSVLYEPCEWTAGHYFVRSRALLVNNPWMNLPIMTLRPAQPSETDAKDPKHMTKLLRTSQVPLDFAIATDCGSYPGTTARVDRLMMQQGLSRTNWGNERLVFYTKGP